MIPDVWRYGEIAVVGLGKSGTAVSQLLAREGAKVYASDAGESAGVATNAAALRELGVSAEAGRHDLDRIGHATLVVVSPGVPPNAAPLERARQVGLPVVSEIEVALHAISGLRYIGITGTNGKTTTTALAAHLLRSLGVNADSAGNIGTPLSEIALRDPRPEWIALEVSSFQLHDTPAIMPAVGIVTNLSPDHLDRYATVDDYYADKALLFRNASDHSRWVLNADEDEVLTLPAHRPPSVTGSAELRGRRFTFSLRPTVVDSDACYDPQTRTLNVLGLPLLPRDELPLIGDHNVANALAASLAVMVADPAFRADDARGRLAEGLRTFHGLPHRLEVAGEFGGVFWINDSKATNVSSTLVALRGMTRPTIVLLGGKHKGEPYTALAEPLRAVAKTVIAYGEAAPLIRRDLNGVVPIEVMGSSFADVIARARDLAAPGETVLLSPACSSYDMFSNYEDRGSTFKRLAAMIPEGRT
jgi:UDP-N-acetylmuramoylalanine--D-glutamate ligase